MGVIGNVLGEVRYVDLPITAGTNPSVSYTVPTLANGDAALALVGIDVVARGATASALSVGGTNVPAGAIASYSNNHGSVFAAAPSGGVPLYTGTQGAVQNNETSSAPGFYANWQSSGVSQGGTTASTTLTTALSLSETTSLAVVALTAPIANGSKVVVASGTHSFTFTASANAAVGATAITVTSATPDFAYPVGSSVLVYGALSGVVDRNGSVPAPGAVTPLSSCAEGQVVQVSLTGAVTALNPLPAPDGNGFISLPTGDAQAGFSNVAVDSIPFRVKESDILLDTDKDGQKDDKFAGMVRLYFLDVTPDDPNVAGKAAGTYPNNGVQKGSSY